tara:strand:+ start:159 stop:308 length:150 start_codon:yes stop_codon:yes gene_type:complete
VDLQGAQFAPPFFCLLVYWFMKKNEKKISLDTFLKKLITWWFYKTLNNF